MCPTIECEGVERGLDHEHRVRHRLTVQHDAGVGGLIGGVAKHLQAGQEKLQVSHTHTQHGETEGREGQACGRQRWQAVGVWGQAGRAWGGVGRAGERAREENSEGSSLPLPLRNVHLCCHTC